MDSDTYCGKVDKVDAMYWKSFGACFDFNSIMGWGPSWGVIDSKYPNMLPIANDFYKISNNGSLSFWDAYRLNKAYNCPPRY